MEGSVLRTRLREALGARDKHVVAVLRETLSAIENAEAPPSTGAPTLVEGPFAGSAGGPGSGEIPRRLLEPEAVTAIVRREIQERQEAAAEYTKLGRHDEARVLISQVEVLVALESAAS